MIEFTPRGGIVFTNDAHRLTVNGAIIAGSRQRLFECVANCSTLRAHASARTKPAVSLGTEVQTVYPEWWGAVGDGRETDDPTDDYDAMQAAIDSGPSRVVLGRKKYVFSGTLTIPSNTTIEGQGVNETVLGYKGKDAAIVGIITNGQHPVRVHLSDFAVSLAAKGEADAPAVGLRFRFSYSSATRVHVQLENKHQTAIELPGYIDGGGPYHNRFSECTLFGGNFINQRGFHFKNAGPTDPPVPGEGFLCPNRNTIEGGRVQSMDISFEICGASNIVEGVAVESMTNAADARAFLVTNDDLGEEYAFRGARDNTISGVYVEGPSGWIGTTFEIRNANGTVIRNSRTGTAAATVLDKGRYTEFRGATNRQIPSGGLKVNKPNASDNALPVVSGVVPGWRLFDQRIHPVSQEILTTHIVDIENAGEHDSDNTYFRVKDHDDNQLLRVGWRTAQIYPPVLKLNAGAAGIYQLPLSPEGVEAAEVGSIAMVSGGDGALWVKTSGSGDSGWLPVGPTRFRTLNANDPTPSVAGGLNFKTHNTSDTWITSFDGGVEGQQIRVFVADPFTWLRTAGSGNIIEPQGPPDCSAVPYCYIPHGRQFECVFDGDDWWCAIP